MAYNISPLENFVKHYVKEHNRVALPIIFIKKAIVLITVKLNNPVCLDPNATINYYTNRDNIFTNTVRQILDSSPKNNFKASYQRTINFLENIVNSTC